MIGPQDGQVVQRHAVGRVRLVERPLLLGEERADALASRRDLLDGLRAEHALHGRRAHEATRHGVDLDHQVVRCPLLLDVRGDHGPQLDHGVVPPPLDPASPGDHTDPVEGQVGGVEEVHLPDLRVERVDPQGRGRLPPVGVRHRHLELDAVRVPRQRQHLADLGIGESSRWLVRGDRHPSLPSSTGGRAATTPPEHCPAPRGAGHHPERVTCSHGSDSRAMTGRRGADGVGWVEPQHLAGAWTEKGMPWITVSVASPSAAGSVSTRW